MPGWPWWKPAPLARPLSAEWLLGVGKQEMYSQKAQNEALLYDTLMIDTCYYKLVQTHRMYKITSEP